MSDFKKDTKKEKKEFMTLAESRAYRLSLFKERTKVLSDLEKREKFRLFWAKNKNKYSDSKDMEDILWIHLQSSNLSEPEKFEEGIKHFGLKKIK